MSNIIRQDISIYLQAIHVAKEVYQLTNRLPAQQQFVLTTQLRRSIVRICNCLANISNSNSKLSIRRSSEQFISAYAEIKTQMKTALTLEHFKPRDLTELEESLDSIWQYCESNLQSYYSN